MTSQIRLDQISREYELAGDPIHALDGVSLDIEAGEFIALVGPSGSGKSTLLNLLGGLDRPSSGDILFMGKSLNSATDRELNAHRRDDVGFIFQTFNLLPTLSAIENVALPLMMDGVPPEVREERADEMLQQVGLGHRLGHRPTELSGGEQQRVAIARALVNQPALVLADEPTGNLDSKTGAEVMSLLQELNRKEGVTILLVTHDPDVAAFADRIVHLKDGQVEKIDAGDKRELTPKNDPPIEYRGKAKISFGDLLRTALKNLTRRPVRNILTSVGIVVGIVTLVSMVSFGVGVQEEVNRNFNSLGLENVFVSPGFDRARESDDSDDGENRGGSELPITPEVLAAFEQLEDVSKVTPILYLPENLEISLSVGEVSLPMRLDSSSGMGPSSLTGYTAPEILAGELLAEGNSAGVLLFIRFADDILEEIGGDYDDLIGQTVILTVELPRGETEEFESQIVGVQDRASYYAGNLGIQEKVAIKQWWFNQPDTLETNGYDLLIVQAVDQSRVASVLETADALGVESQSLGAVLEIANRVLAILQAMLGSIGGLALLVAALGVANTMMMAIYERTREIGILKALGASNREIRRMFIADAILLALIGGLVGLLLGTLLGHLVDQVGHWYIEQQGVKGIGRLSVVPAWLAILSLAFSAFIGVLGGYFPASRAARLDPVEALKHE